MPTGERGFTYLWLLFVVALGGVALAALGQRQQLVQQREREAELRFRGDAIAKAITAYGRASPAGTNGLPQRLEDLLEDRRSGAVQRHLRRLYADPFTGRADWVLVQGQAALKPSAQDGSSDESEKLVHKKPAFASAPVPTGEALGAPLMTGIVGVSSRSQALLLGSAALASATEPGAAASPSGQARKPRVADLQFLAVIEESSPE